MGKGIRQFFTQKPVDACHEKGSAGTPAPLQLNNGANAREASVRLRLFATAKELLHGWRAGAMHGRATGLPGTTQ